MQPKKEDSRTEESIAESRKNKRNRLFDISKKAARKGSLFVAIFLFFFQASMKYSYVRLVASLSKSHPLFEIFTAGMVTVEKMQSVSFENIGHSFLNSRRKCNHGRHNSI